MGRISLLLAALAFAAPAMAQTAPALRIALADDPDMLDPTQARTYAGRFVFAALCDKLFDINEKLEIVPQLAIGHEWTDSKTLVLRLRPNVTFHDRTPVDAAALKYSMERHLTMQGSTRRGEVASIDHVELVDPLTARIVLRTPSAPFLSLLTDRAGMLVSPKAAEAAGKDFGANPVCSGPFRFVERIAQDRIVLDRYPGYWDAGNVHVGRVVYRSVVDNSVRLTNLQAGALDMAERIGATDVGEAKQDSRLNVFVYPGLGYASLNFNVSNGPRADSPVGRSVLVRKAFELSVDRTALVQVVYNGLFTPVAQAMGPANPFYNAGVKPTERNVAKAKELLRQAGVALPVVVNLTVTTSPDQRQTGEILQSMAAEAGFDVRVRSTEFGSALAAQTRGDFEISAIGWSGRIDPDGNIYNGLHSKGALNETHYANPELDAWLDAARTTNDFAGRKALYARITAKVHEDLPVMYLYNTALIVAATKKLSGFRPVPDGIIRVQGLRLAP